MKKRVALILMLPALLLGCGKSNKQTYSPIPYVAVSLQINTNDPLYQNLDNIGGYVYIPGQGFKGLLLICDLNYNINAYDRACPYNDTVGCAILTVVSGNIDIECGEYENITQNGKQVSKWNTCCGSKWNYEGTVTSGPAIYGPKRYTVTPGANGVLNISN